MAVGPVDVKNSCMVRLAIFAAGLPARNLRPGAHRRRAQRDRECDGPGRTPRPSSADLDHARKRLRVHAATNTGRAIGLSHRFMRHPCGKPKGD